MSNLGPSSGSSLTRHHAEVDPPTPASVVAPSTTERMVVLLCPRHQAMGLGSLFAPSPSSSSSPSSAHPAIQRAPVEVSAAVETILVADASLRHSGDHSQRQEPRGPVTLVSTCGSSSNREQLMLLPQQRRRQSKSLATLTYDASRPGFNVSFQKGSIRLRDDRGFVWFLHPLGGEDDLERLAWHLVLTRLRMTREAFTEPIIQEFVTADDREEEDRSDRQGGGGATLQLKFSAHLVESHERRLGPAFDDASASADPLSSSLHPRWRAALSGLMVGSARAVLMPSGSPHLRDGFRGSLPAGAVAAYTVRRLAGGGGGGGSGSGSGRGEAAAKEEEEAKSVAVVRPQGVQTVSTQDQVLSPIGEMIDFASLPSLNLPETAGCCGLSQQGMMLESRMQNAELRISLMRLHDKVDRLCLTKAGNKEVERAKKESSKLRRRISELEAELESVRERQSKKQEEEELTKTVRTTRRVLASTFKRLRKGGAFKPEQTYTGEEALRLVALQFKEILDMLDEAQAGRPR